MIVFMMDFAYELIILVKHSPGASLSLLSVDVRQYNKTKYLSISCMSSDDTSLGPFPNRSKTDFTCGMLYKIDKALFHMP